MSRVEHFGHGVYCEKCQDVHDSTDGCDHRFEKKNGVRKEGDYYIAQPPNMGHFSPHMWMDVDDMEVCGECGATKIPKDMVQE